ncbi:hypothetical protein EJ05DRAFT_282385 [Pseudovirgaria hyperparasitica]|uniref:DUF572-domain-containing protein n=1 Tax=Pseudovirgaria hyperparasitica TaxID=470096 RepID=A0A6A6WBY6_9PEZI|nr:uncharacterized protein EJ05DRAFT_282385 [Pseudovirgaria hyperparasitica]KAF2760358.1 hypothetical protein EJ05DRAFT_282385 [Pseudovirgaria hyperparasitica]
MQGFNMGRYYPPSTTSPPRFNSSSTLKTTQKRTPAGSQIVRFEMPFHVWCAHCPAETIIPQGVRFNAEKKKIGMYFSTPIWSFRMKHSVCGGAVEIRTDPGRADYVVYEGGRKRDYGAAAASADDEEGGVGEGRFLSEEERAKRRSDAFASLEGKVEEKAKVRESRERVEELYAAREKDWKDPYAASKRLRSGFRKDRKVRAGQEEERGRIRDRYGFGEEFEIVDETEGDRARAGLIEFGAADGEDLAAKPLFALADSDAKEGVMIGLTKAKKEAAGRKVKLQKQLQGNTRAALDPFRISKTPKPVRPFLGIKKSLVSTSNQESDKEMTASALVAYESE